MGSAYDADRFVGTFLLLRGGIALALGAAMFVLFLASFWTDLRWVNELLGTNVAVGNNGTSPRIAPGSTVRGVLGIVAPIVVVLGGFSRSVGVYVSEGHEPGFTFGVLLEGALLVLSAWLALSVPVTLGFWIWSLPLFAYFQARCKGMGPVPRDPYADLDGDPVENTSPRRVGSGRTVR